MSMFGTGFGQNNQQQQQQQQQQQPNAFGQPSTFGSSGFGAFGQNAQQQPQPQPQQPQPQVNPMFGNLASSTSNTGGGFGASRSVQPASSTALSTPSNATGAFGGASTSSGAFGQPKPAFGSSGGPGAFGGGQPSAFGNAGGGGAFGNASTSGAFGGSGSGGGVFGQPAGQQQQNAFGGSNSLFGKSQGTGFGANALTTSTGLTTGSSNPPYQEVQERDPTAVVSTTLHYQAISCMPAYRNVSFEELRVQDYQQGRKTANSFGNPAFGQPAQQQQSNAGIFGQSSTTGAFGQPAQTAPSGFGAFGQPQPQQQQGAFGAFGQPQQQPSTSAFGAFGQQNQQPASGFGAFGQQNQQQPQPATGFGAFGQQSQQNKGFGAFAQPQGNAPFSAFASNATSTPTAGTSAFGQNQQNQQNQSPFGAFGQQNNQANQQQGANPLLKPSVFGTPAGGLFGNTGQQQQQQQPQQGGGLFGNTGQSQQQSGGLFGNTASGTGAFGQPLQQSQQPNAFGQPSTGSGGLFSNANQQQNQAQQNQQTPGSGFGSLFTKPAGSGFGTSATTQQNQQPNPNPSNPLFSSGGGSGGGLFGNSNTQQQQPFTTNPLFVGGGGSLFGGQKPAAPASGFGALGGGGLFGNTQQQQQPAQGGLFGNTNSQPQQTQQPSLFGGSLFGGSTQQQQSQPSLTASIDQPLPSTMPTSLPQLPSLAASLSPKKKSNAFADIAARSSPRIGLGVGLNYTPPVPGSKLRGFGTNASTSTVTKNPFSLPPPGFPGKTGAPFGDSKSLLPPDAFSSGSGGSLQLLGGGRQSVKKLVLDKRVDEDELHSLRTTRADSPARAREVRFNPALSVAAREKDNDPRRSASPAVTPPRAVPRPGSRLHDSGNISAAKTTVTGPVQSTPLDPQEGEYWSLPPVVELQRLSFTELQSVKDFTVGRVGFGTIQFLQPVDLTSVPSIADIPGKIVTFEHVECVLYPDERLKPPQGEGLNVPARIKLDRCWALDKSTREPIKDPNDTKHLQRLRKMREQDGAEFVGFDMETGVWEFTVQEF